MKIALFGKTLAPENGDYMRQLLTELAERQAEITIYQPFASLIAACIPEVVQYTVFRSHDDLKADLMFSIGGDGTILDTVPLSSTRASLWQASTWGVWASSPASPKTRLPWR